MAGRAAQLPKWQISKSCAKLCAKLAVANAVPQKYFSFGMKLYFFSQKILLALVDNYCIMIAQEKEREKEMKKVHEFSVDELKMLHLSVIRSERIIRRDYIPMERDASKVASLTDEADALNALGKKVCAAQLSLELGFYVEPLPVGA